MQRIAISSEGGPGVGASTWGLALATVALLLFLIATKTLAGDAEVSASQVDDKPTALSLENGGPAAIIKMNDDMPMYQPPTVRILAGQTIEWENNGAVSHSVVDDPSKADKPDDALLPAGVEPFTSGNVMPGGKFRHTFLLPGRYRYFCLSHEIDSMVGEVIVQPSTRVQTPRAASERPQPWRLAGHSEDPRRR